MIGAYTLSLPALLVASAFVLNPTANVAPPWIMMGPVNYAAAIIPFILAVERHSIADAK